MAVSEAIKGRKPSPLMEALKRRLTEGAGVLLVFASLLLAVALASFDHNDPSPNHATDAPVTNIAGPVGAAVADLLLQAVGLAAILLPAILLAWAFRLLLNRGVTQLTLNGQPLYYFTPDIMAKNKHQALGDELKTFGSIWHIVRASDPSSGTAPASMPTTPTSTNPYPNGWG